MAAVAVSLLLSLPPAVHIPEPEIELTPVAQYEPAIALQKVEAVSYTITPLKPAPQAPEKPKAVSKPAGDIEAKVRVAGGEALVNLIRKESNFNPYAVNKSSGACGLGQANPCSKLLNVCGSLDNIDCQIQWVLDYCNDRYGSPESAWNYWQSNHWY